jgi:transcriptional regulator with XRE-family HTH domain
MPLYDVPPDSFGAQLEKVRKLRGLNQTQLGSEIGVVGAYVSQWESAKSLPRPPIIAKLEQVLQCLFRCSDRGGWAVYYPIDPSAYIPLISEVTRNWGNIL